MKQLQAIKRFAVAAAVGLLSTAGVSAGTYYIHSSVGSLNDGDWVTYRDHYFKVGETAFSSIWGLLNKGLEENSEIYFGPGTYGNITISTPNVTLLGANAYCDAWSGQRVNEESNVTGVWKINASGVTVNGFRFTAGGCVRNDDAARGSKELTGFTYIYNKAEESTLTRDDNTAIVYLGESWRPASTNADKQNPTAWAAVDRYKDVTIAHNGFYGKDADDQPYPVWVAGSYGTTRVVDNCFDKGGTSVSLFNTEGAIDVSHNRFTDVGAGQRKAGSATGEFCLRLYYISCKEGVDGSVCHNTFDNCQGQSSMYSLIRFFSGDSNETAYSPVNCSLKVNHNTFRNKTVYRTSDGYNYVFYGNNTITTTASVDWRWNHYDNSEMCFGWVKPSWASASGRYFGGSSEIFEHSTGTTTGTEVDFYGKKDANGVVQFGRETPTGGAGGLKGWTYGTQSPAGRVCTTVTQSMDIDDATGDIYTIQESSKTSKFGTGINDNVYTVRVGSDKFLFMTRVAKTSSGYSETHMYLTFGGHGSNMAVTRWNGQVYILTGGAGTQSSTNPTKICIFPWTEWAAIDLRQTNSNGVEIKHFGNEYSHTMPYPSVDNDNRLFVERSRENDGDYFTVYNLDDIMSDPSTARPIKQVFVPAHTNKITGSSRAFLNTADLGFKTWSDQGFTISGDYIYAYEGDGKGGYGSNPVPTDGKAVLIINAINWRTGEYVYRKAILKKTILDEMCTGDDSGEPESLKIHRDDTGRPFMVIGIVTGASGARKYNCFAYKQRRGTGQGRVLDLPTASFSSDQASLQLSCVSRAEATLSCSSGGDVRDIHATIVGPDGGCFSVEKTGGDVIDGNHTFSVAFTPDAYKRSYSAFVRLSSPNTPDVMVPLSGTYLGDVITGVADIDADDDAGLDGAEYYDLHGRRLAGPQQGLNIVRCSDGSSVKLVVN